MSHPRELLASERDEALGPTEFASLRAHLVECEDCRSLRRELARNDDLLRRREPAFALDPLRRRSRRAPAVLASRLALATIVVVASVAAGRFIAGARAPEPAASATATATSVATTDLSWDIFTMTLPPGWSGEPRQEFLDMATARLVVAGNAALGLPSPLPRQIDWSSLPPERVVLEVRSVCRLACIGPETESAFPLEWATAERLPDDAGFATYQLAFRYFDVKEFLVAHIGSKASAKDRSALAALVASIRPLPIPQVGYYRAPEWYAVGSIDHYAVGSVTRLVIPASPPRNEEPLLLVRGRQHLVAFPVTQGSALANNFCDLRFDAASNELRCDLTGERWSIYGNRLPQSGAMRTALGYHLVEVRDGTVLIYVRGVASPPDLNDADESLLPTSCATASSASGTLTACPGSGPVGTRVTVEGTCRLSGAPATLYWIFETEGFLSGKDGWDGTDITTIPVDRDGRFSFTYVVPRALQQIQQSGGGPTTPGGYRFMTKPAACIVPFTVTAP